LASGSWRSYRSRTKKLRWGTHSALAVGDSPEVYDCKKCLKSGKRNKVRGRECLLNETLTGKRDLTKNPIPYEFKVRNLPAIAGLVSSEEDLVNVFETALETFQTTNMDVALRRVGKGICPKSFPLSPQSLYFLDLYHKTHGGEAGCDLTHLPIAGGLLDQPNIFFSAVDVIRAVKIDRYNRKIDAPSEGSRKNDNKDALRGKAGAGEGNQGQGSFTKGG
jgi:hypothetical protein